MDNGSKMCNTCCKEDVCIYKGELAQFTKEVSQLEQKLPISVFTIIKCDKYVDIKSTQLTRTPKF